MNYFNVIDYIICHSHDFFFFLVPCRSKPGSKTGGWSTRSSWERRRMSGSPPRSWNGRRTSAATASWRRRARRSWSAACSRTHTCWTTTTTKRTTTWTSRTTSAPRIIYYSRRQRCFLICTSAVNNAEFPFLRLQNELAGLNKEGSICTVTNLNIYLNMRSGSVHCNCHVRESF